MRKAIIAPAMAMVTPVSRAALLVQSDAAAKKALSEGRIVTPAEVTARIAAKEAADLAQKKATSLAKREAKKANAPPKPEKPAQEEKPSKPEAVKVAPKPVPPVKSPRDLIYEAVELRTMSCGEAAIRLAALDGKVVLDRALPPWHAAQILPDGLVIPEILRDLARKSGGILTPMAVRTTVNPMATALRAQVVDGSMTLEAARKLLLSTTKDVKVVDPKRAWESTVTSRSMLVSQLVCVLPDELVSAPVTKGEKAVKNLVCVTFTMLRRGSSDEERVSNALQAWCVANPAKDSRLAIEWAMSTWKETGVLPEGLKVSFTEAAPEVEVERYGAPGELLAKAVTFLDSNADALSVRFETGTILTMYYQDLESTDPTVRAILGPAYKRATEYGEWKPTNGIAVKRAFVNHHEVEEESECRTAKEQAHAKGLQALAEGLKLGSKVLRVGQDPMAIGWDKPLKPGQYVMAGVFEVKDPVTKEPTGEVLPTVCLMQRITSFSNDSVLRRETIREDVRGIASPSVESTLSVSGKRGGAAIKAPKNYNRNATGSWQRGGNSVAATLCKDYRIGMR